MMDAVYEASPLKRRMTKAEVEQLEAQILDVLAEDSQQSVRHVFYRMTENRGRLRPGPAAHGRDAPVRDPAAWRHRGSYVERLPHACLLLR